MVFALVQSLSLASPLALLFVALVLASEVGHRLGGHFGRGRQRDKDAATLATAAFALLAALLIAFTYSMALMRYDMRRTVVLEQANALRDAARVVPLLPNGSGAEVLDDLRREADLATGSASRTTRRSSTATQPPWRTSRLGCGNASMPCPRIRRSRFRSTA